MRVLIVMVLLFVGSVSYANQKALTDTGDQVILYDDGTWKYADDSKNVKKEIVLNTEEFIKPKSSSFLLKSTKNKAGFWINTDSWSFTKAPAQEAAEYQFELKGKDLWGLSISEGIPLPIESLANVAFKNAQEAAPDAKIVKQEYRVVNGHKVLYMEIQGTIDGINFQYLGYYHSDDSGSTQFLTYTAASLVEKYSTEIYEFLNGFTLQ